MKNRTCFCIKLLFIAFMMFILNSYVFCTPPQKISRQKALEMIAVATQNFPRINYLYPEECPNCKNYTEERDFYFVSFDGIFENSVVFFIGFCKHCNYLECGYHGDDNTNKGGYLYRGTK